MIYLIRVKAKEVRQILRISDSTLGRYCKEGLIRRTKVGHHYDYDSRSVYQLLNKNRRRKTYLYARVSTNKQKNALETQIKLLQSWAQDNGYQIHGVFADIASGINFEKRKEFFQLLKDLLDCQLPRPKGRGLRGDLQEQLVD